jgi:hypothetical protein
MTFQSKEKCFWNPEIGKFDIKHSIYMYIHIFVITILKYLKNLVSFPSGFCSNKNKNKLFSLPSPAFFKILKEPMLAQK